MHDIWTDGEGDEMHAAIMISVAIVLILAGVFVGISLGIALHYRLRDRDTDEWPPREVLENIAEETWRDHDQK